MSQAKLTREQAAQFLTQRGYRTTIGALAQHAHRGTGPAYQVYGRFTVYEADELLRWAEARLRPSVAEVRRGEYLTRDMRPAT
jgi:hypothetical protein